MIISHKYKFIFIKTFKTAGTSLEVYLSNLCGQNDIITPIHPNIENHRPRNYIGLWNPIPNIINRGGIKHGPSLPAPYNRNIILTMKNFLRLRKYYNHITANNIKNRVSEEVWNTYYKFCIERNPWDKTYSMFCMIKNRTGGSLSFNEFLERMEFPYNYPIYMDIKRDEILVDRILKYEELNSELDDLLQYLGVPFDGQLTVNAKGDHRKKKQDYRDIYTIDQKRQVEEYFRKEIQLFSYKFNN